jgi:plastocyanin
MVTVKEGPMGTGDLRRRLGRVALAATAGLLLLAGCGDDDGGEQADETTTAPDELIGVDSCNDIPESAGDEGALNQGAIVNMIEFEFCQDDITVQAGETVRWENNGSTRHQVVHAPTGDQERQFGPEEAMLPGDYYDFTFTEPGTYPYICTFHAEQMIGTVIVEGAASDASTTTA